MENHQGSGKFLPTTLVQVKVSQRKWECTDHADSRNLLMDRFILPTIFAATFIRSPIIRLNKRTAVVETRCIASPLHRVSTYLTPYQSREILVVIIFTKNFRFPSFLFCHDC